MPQLFTPKAPNFLIAYLSKLSHPILWNCTPTLSF